MMAMRAAMLVPALLSVAAPAGAQASAGKQGVVPAEAAMPVPIDPARLAAARHVVDQVWPLGTYKRMMDKTLDAIMDSTMQSMFNMKLGDFSAAAGISPEQRAKLGEATMGEVMLKADPHYRERAQITMTVMMDEMVGLMTQVEPDVRDALSRAYARRFTETQLADLIRFFSTETGKVYAAESMMLFSDPEMMKAMQSFTPRLMQAMPSIMAKAQKATARLPPVKVPGEK